jgi:hypothetical protein
VNLVEEVSTKQSISRMTLASAITEAVKKSGPECERFIGVVIEREKPTSQSQTNWSIRGVRFGKSDRKKASDALATILERLQREFSLSEENSGES